MGVGSPQVFPWLWGEDWNLIPTAGSSAKHQHRATRERNRRFVVNLLDPPKSVLDTDGICCLVIRLLRSLKRSVVFARVPCVVYLLIQCYLHELSCPSDTACRFHIMTHSIFFIFFAVNVIHLRVRSFCVWFVRVLVLLQYY